MKKTTLYVWITLLSNLSVDPLIAGLVRKGLSVEALSSDHNLISSYGDFPTCCLMALKIEISDDILKKYPPKEDEEDRATPSYLVDLVKGLCRELKIKYFSLIISEVSSCCWSASNFQFPKPPGPPRDLFEESVSADILGDKPEGNPEDKPEDKPEGS